MLVNGILKNNSVSFQQKSKENFAESPSMAEFETYAPLSLEASMAYASPQVNNHGYREIQTVKFPYLENGKFYQLSNGHKVLLLPKMGETIINTYVGVGVNNEPEGKKECSHLLEHLLGDYVFKPKNNDLSKTLDDLGTESNAETSDFHTGYHISAFVDNPEDFETLVKLQSQTIQNTNFTDKDVEDEKFIIKQEKGQRGSENNYSNIVLANKLALQNLYNLKDTDSILSLSNEKTIDNIKKDDLENYYNRFYTPDNMFTVVVGKVDANSIKAIDKYLNYKKRPNLGADKNIYPKIPVDNLIQKTVRKDVFCLDKNTKDAYTDLAFIGPKKSETKDSVLSSVICDIIDSKLEEKAKLQDKALDVYIGIGNMSADKNVPTYIDITHIGNSKDVEENIKNIYSVITDLTQNQVSEDVLNKIKANRKESWSRSIENKDLLSSKIAESGILSQNIDPSLELNIIDKMTPKDIQDVAKKYFDLNKTSLVVIHPQANAENKKDNVETAKNLNGIKKVNNVSFKGNAEIVHVDDLQEYVLPNNLRVIVDVRPGVARTSIKYKFNSKKMLYSNPAAATILSNLSVSKETKEKLKVMGLAYENESNSQYIGSLIIGTPEKTLEMLGYGAGMLLYPALTNDRFNVLKDYINIYKNKTDDKDTHAQNKFNDLFYGDNPFNLKKGDFKGIELEDVKNLHNQILKNAQGTVCITMPKEDFEKNKTEIFETLMKIPKLQPYDYSAFFNKYKAKPLSKNEVILDKNNSEQIKVFKTYKIIEGGNVKDKAGLLILNYLIGGDEKSRLQDKLRNKDKIAYSADSMFNGDFFIQNLSEIQLATEVSSSNKDNLKTVISEFDNSTNELISKPVSQAELNRVKKKIRNKFLSTLESSVSRNSILSDNYDSFYGIEYQKELLDAIDNMTPEYIQELAKYYLKQPYILEITGNKDFINNNKQFISTLGEVNE